MMGWGYMWVGGRTACFLSYVFGGCIYIHTVAAAVVDTGAIQTYIYTTDGVQGGGQREGGRGTARDDVHWKFHCEISGWHRCGRRRGLVRIECSSRIDE